MKVSCNINDVIDFLTNKRNEGYTSVEIIDDARAAGWFSLEPTLEFIFSKSELNVVGIDVRNKNK